MPIIQEESDSVSNKLDKQLKFNNAKLNVSNFHDEVIKKNRDTDILDSEISIDTLRKIKQNEDAQISKMAEHMAKMTEVTLQKIKQNEDARISKMAEHMAKMTEDTISKFEKIQKESRSKSSREIKLPEPMNLPCFQ
ncbi:MAG TPA: hypothetical protein VLD38_08640 [Nitrosopumilaceae archaeon]|nr:hypothetical protein [Nitrosopumilaceae archaeon]